nr:L727 [uncultured bacterium]
MGAGSTNLKEIIMANIGTFTKTGNEYKGEIVTMSVQQKNVRIVLETSDNENAPSHRVFVGRAEIGAAWTKTSNEGRDYLSVKLDDPSFTAPIFANLFDDEDGKSYNLIWSRARRTNGD